MHFNFNDTKVVQGLTRGCALDMIFGHTSACSKLRHVYVGLAGRALPAWLTNESITMMIELVLH